MNVSLNGHVPLIASPARHRSILIIAVQQRTIATLKLGDTSFETIYELLKGRDTVIS